MIQYRIGIADAQAHRFDVALTIPEPAAGQVVSLPVWIPGSYLVREFARHLSGLEAHQDGRAVRIQQTDKASWRMDCRGGAALELRYRVYAYDTSVRAAFLDPQRGFFNGTGTCLRVHGQEARPHAIELTDLPDGWQVATAMPPDAVRPQRYASADYDELVDHPFELGRHWRGTFTAAGVPHEFVVAGALPDFDGERLLADAQRICETHIAFWHGATHPTPPFDRYVFMLNTAEDGHGGLEHRASTALLAARRDLPRRGAEPPVGANGGGPGDGYVNLLGLISHEYFHAWNVKRMRPREFERYDYSRENYTELLWFFEGHTSYYDDLLLLRAGLIDPSRYLKLLAKPVSGVLATPGRGVHSVAQSSFEAWTKFYRADENTPNATISYYAKGSLVALALDLTLRREGKGTLDEVMRTLWRSGGGGPIDEADIAAALETVGGRSYARELAAWVHGTDELPLPALLADAGVDWQPQPATLAQRLGLRVSESALTGVRVTHVLRGGAAEQAGLAAGDELIALGDWRLRRLDDALRLLADAAPTPLLVARDQRLLRLSLTLPPPAPASQAVGAVALALAEGAPPAALALRKAWLAT
ncbi:MAG: PDZ domain-containing protein [Burkholderiaceae bacterium]